MIKVGMRKRAQLTLFVVIGIVIVVGVLVFFLYVRPTLLTSQQGKLAVENCIQTEIKNGIKNLALSAGLGDEKKMVEKYMDENVSVLCYTQEYYTPCVVQLPFIERNFEKKLSDAVGKKVDECYQKSVDELKAQGFDVSSEGVNYSLKITPRSVEVVLMPKLTIGNGDSSASLRNNFTIVYPTEIYTLLAVADSILQFESRYGDAESTAYMYYYPNLKVEKIRRENGFKIYVITHKIENVVFKFASRSVVWPAGYGALEE